MANALESAGRTIMVQGRLVWIVGDLHAGRIQTEHNSQKPKVNEKGEQVKQYGFGLAVDSNTLFPNGQLAPNTIWTAIHEEAQTIYRNGTPPDFAYKYKIGDRDLDKNGEPLAKRDGYKGHVVFGCTTNIPIKFFKWDQNAGQNVQINSDIFCGDYIQVQLTIKAHGPINNGKPGLYLNPMAVLFVGHGPRIINTPSGDDIFGRQAPALPPGASATPLAPTGAAAFMPPGAPVYQQPLQQPAQPHYGALPPQFQPQQNAPTAVPTMTSGTGAVPLVSHGLPQMPGFAPTVGPVNQMPNPFGPR